VVEMKTKYINSGGVFEITITTDPSGRTSIVVYEKNKCQLLVDVELPAKKGQDRDAFKPTVHISEGQGVEIQKMA
jgi:hypothetical protein